MIELTWTSLFMIAALGSVFLFSIITNFIMMALVSFLTWFSYNAKTEIVTTREELSKIVTYSNIGDSIDQVLESFVSLGTKLEQVNEMPIFSDEPIVVELIEEIDATLRDVERLLLDRDLVEFLDLKSENNDVQ